MAKYLSDYQISLRFFDRLDEIIKNLKAEKGFSDRQQSDLVNRTLLNLIQKEEEPCFLLPAVLEFIERVDREDILYHYRFNSFELWLNQHSGLSFDENYRVRAKIAGKFVERGDYQNIFPIGMGKVYEGTHFVTAHKSPDLDTTIASFWGWLDAFAARVGDGLHVWNVPGGPPESQIEIEWIFRNLFGPGVFSHLAKTRTVLNLTGNDLMTQKGLQKKRVEDSLSVLDHDSDGNAIVVVDSKGFFLGDWRLGDVEGVRQVILSLSSCLRWFENTLQLKLIAFFAKESLNIEKLLESVEVLLALSIRKSEPVEDFSARQKKQVDLFVKEVLKIEKGLDSSFEEVAKTLGGLGDVPYGGVKGLANKMRQATLFDEAGAFVGDRSQIFSFLENVLASLHLGILKIRSRVEKLDIALKTKFDVFGHKKNTVTVRSDVEEIKAKIGHYSYLTVTYPEEDAETPVGIIYAKDLRKKTLGTVSLRDFCNREEMGIPSYLEVISVIDHHKSSLNTFLPPLAIISDVQSSNTLVALKAFEINDQKNKKPYFIHPQREYIEYLHFLYGIIDDTDLLSKVSLIDVQVVASLLNRLKSISLGKAKVVIDLDDLARDKTYPKRAAKKILQTEDMYFLYKKVYEFREEEVSKNIKLASQMAPSNLFADTKEQNGCCRVGQTKIFQGNFPTYEKHKNAVRKAWVSDAEAIFSAREEFDLHLHMISTVVDAESVYQGTQGEYSHLDELWIWIPEKNEVAVENLKLFLNAFQASPGFVDNHLEVEFLGENGGELSSIFKESFFEIPETFSSRGLNIAVLKYRAGTLNSRKSMISPFLPKSMSTK